MDRTLQDISDMDNSANESAKKAMEEIKAIVENMHADAASTARLKKAIAIGDACIDLARELAASLAVAYPRKRIFRTKNRTPKSRRTKAMAKFKVGLDMLITANKVYHIATQPIISGDDRHDGDRYLIGGTVLKTTTP